MLLRKEQFEESAMALIKRAGGECLPLSFVGGRETQRDFDNMQERRLVVMTEKEQRQKLVAAAKKYYGSKEADGSHKKIIDLYNQIPITKRGYTMQYSDPWCAAFVSAVGYEAGMLDIVLASANCDGLILKHKEAGSWVEDDAYQPTAGDLIFYDWQDSGAGDNTGGADHVGIVAEVYDKTMRVIEGNISDAVGYRLMSVNGRYIRGYAVPKYGEQGVAATSKTSTQAKDSAGEILLPNLQRGSKGKHVHLLQWLLLREGYSCGGKKIGGIEQTDGDFGDMTYKSLLAYQIREGLTTDGICGRESWSTLLK